MSNNAQSKRRKTGNVKDSEQFSKANLLERRIEELKDTIVREKDQFLKEDLKARGLKELKKTE